MRAKIVGEVKIGSLLILKFSDGSLWIENAAGEGMSVQEKDLEEIILQFWEDSF